MSSIDSPPIREKFHLMRTVVSTHQELFTSFRRGIEHASWVKFCATFFGFKSVELEWRGYADDGPLFYQYNPTCVYPTPIARYGQFAETESFVPEPVLSYRLANVAISCMKYLHRLDFNTLLTHYHFLASWARRSKQLPWLWRRRMRITSMRRQRPVRNHGGHKCSFPQKLQQSRQITYSEKIGRASCRERVWYWV